MERRERGRLRRRGLGTVYRWIGSKEEIRASIMRSFGKKVGAGWVSVLDSPASPIEKLDALCWVDINALEQLHDEFRIQLAWLRQSPPDPPNPGGSFTARLRQLRSLLTEGIRSGEIRIESPSTSGSRMNRIRAEGPEAHESG